MTNTMFLNPIDGRKSFYGKARVEIEGNTKTLISYATKVMRIEDGKIIRMWGGYSSTTMRHINSFLAMFADGQKGKAFWDSLPIEQ